MSVETHRLALPVGTIIEHFRVESVLGKGGFGITYRALDMQLGKQVAIKELLPDTIATRVDGSTVVPHSSSMLENWSWARERFLEEARTLAGFSHPSIVGVHRLIETNGTVYMVMDFVEGESYEARLRRIGQEPDQASLLAVISPILEGLQEVHAKGLLHRDIKPDNILINQRGQPILIDFGSARSSIGATLTMTSIVTHGYSPIEQYQTKGRMGPWTDIYALGAVMCRAITGEKPPVAADRAMEDDFIWLSYRSLPGFSTEFLQAVDWALRVRPEERAQFIDEWKPHVVIANPSQRGVEHHVAAKHNPTTTSCVTDKNSPLAAQSSLERKSVGTSARTTAKLSKIPNQPPPHTITSNNIDKKYGGIGRLTFVGISIGIIIIQYILILITTVTSEDLIVLRLVCSLLLFLSFFVAPFIPVYYRLKNIGTNPWWCLLMLVPLLNLLVLVRCLVFQGGYEGVKKLDSSGRIIVYILAGVLGLPLILILLLLLTAVLASVNP